MYAYIFIKYNITYEIKKKKKKKGYFRRTYGPFPISCLPNWFWYSN